LIVVLTGLRLPFLNHPTPVTVDETYFILGLGFPAEYPVHHPGYPLWVALGTVLHAAGLDAYRSYQAWSLAASLAGPLLFYVGLRRLLADGPAWWLALAWGVNPLVWFQSVTALSYMTAGVVGLLVLGASYRAIVEGQGRGALQAAAWLVVTILLRADYLVYLGPLVLVAACLYWRRGGRPTLLILVLGVAALVAVTWLLYHRVEPTGPRPTLGHTVDVILGTSVFRLGLVDGLVRNLVKIALNLGWDFGVAVLLLVWAVWRVLRNRGLPSRRGLFLILWTLPAICFLCLMHVVQGYFMLLLPAGYLLIGIAASERWGPAKAWRIAAALAICSTAQFLFYPWSAESSGFKRLLDAKIAFQSASGIRQIDKLELIHTPGDFWPTAVHTLSSNATSERFDRPSLRIAIRR
jgi:hypothetical protein